MFRNALRQSTRAVGAVSAAGRVSVVSVLKGCLGPPAFHRKGVLEQHASTENASYMVNWILALVFPDFWELFGSCSTTLLFTPAYSGSVPLTCFSRLDPKCRTRRHQRCPRLRLRC